MLQLKARKLTLLPNLRRRNQRRSRSQKKKRRKMKPKLLPFTLVLLRTGPTSSSSSTASPTTLTCATSSSSWPRSAPCLAWRIRRSTLTFPIWTPAPTLSLSPTPRRELSRIYWVRFLIYETRYWASSMLTQIEFDLYEVNCVPPRPSFKVISDVKKILCNQTLYFLLYCSDHFQTLSSPLAGVSR